MTASIRRHRWLAVAATLALTATACGGRDDGGSAGGDGDGGTAASPGITDDTITFGSSYPLSGPASAYATIRNAVDACFAAVNADGGVEMGDGVTRQLELEVLDDGYDPARSAQNARQLVQQEQVFALFNPLGTAHNEAMRDYLNEEEVPHVFVATGASELSSAADEYPWTIGWQPTYSLEATIYGEFLKEQRPEGGTVAVLYQNDEYGEEFVGAFEAAIEGSDFEIVARESYEATDPSVESQMVNLAQSGADVFLNAATPRAAAQAIGTVAATDWDPLHVLNAVANSTTTVLEPVGFEAAEGVWSAVYLMEAGTDEYADEPAMQEYLDQAEEYGSFDPADPFGIFGFSVCHTLVEVLENTGEPTREAFMESVRNLDFELPLGLSNVTTGDDDPFAIESMQMAQFTDGAWDFQDDVYDYEGETPLPGE